MCGICHSMPIRLPVIVTKCCKTILCCEQCVNSWYSGPEMLYKICPLCRAERSCNETMVLRWLDDFLTLVVKILQAEEGDESDANMWILTELVYIQTVSVCFWWLLRCVNTVCIKKCVMFAEVNAFVSNLFAMNSETVVNENSMSCLKLEINDGDGGKQYDLC